MKRIKIAPQGLEGEDHYRVKRKACKWSREEGNLPAQDRSIRCTNTMYGRSLGYGVLTGLILNSSFSSPLYLRKLVNSDKSSMPTRKLYKCIAQRDGGVNSHEHWHEMLKLCSLYLNNYCPTRQEGIRLFWNIRAVMIFVVEYSAVLPSS